MSATMYDDMTAEARTMARQITQETDGLLRAIARAEADLRDARQSIELGQRPGSGNGTGRILSQSALDVDGYSSRLHAILDVAAAVLTPEQMQNAYEEGRWA